MKPIAKIITDFPTKFGIPRQSGLADELEGTIIFEKEFRNPDALNGLNGFSHLWIIWEFSENKRGEFHATVRPPRLGGNNHLGVFATRSPFRPNPLGLSCVKIESIEYDTENGAVIHVKGADMVSGTPIYDIKPYIPFTDSHPEASEGFTQSTKLHFLEVVFPDSLKGILPETKEKALMSILSEDPRPSYARKDENRIYGFPFAGHEIKFKVVSSVLTIVSIEKNH